MTNNKQPQPPENEQDTDVAHDQKCFVCQWWHEDGGEGPSMFCPDVEPIVVTRGPNWKPKSNA